MNFLTSEFSKQFINSFFWACIHSLWQGLLLFIIGYFLVDVLKKQSANVRYNLLFALLAVFTLSFLITIYFQLESIKRIEATRVAITTFEDPILCTPQYIAQTDGPIESAKGFFDRNYLFFTLIWFFIFVYKVVKISYQLRSIEHLLHKHSVGAVGEWDDMVTRLSRKLGILKRVTLRVSEKVTSPAVVGFWHSFIVVPVGLLSSLPYEQVEAILLHELAHIKRNDYLFNFFQLLIEAAFYFNPGVLLLSRLIRIERENCCDDIAVNQTHNPYSLASALVSSEEFRTNQMSLTLGLNGVSQPTLLSRVKRLVKDEQNKTLTTATVSKSILFIVPLAFAMFLFQSFQLKQNLSRGDNALSGTTIVTSGVNYFEKGVVGPGTSIRKRFEINGTIIYAYVLEDNGIVYQIEKQNNQITHVIVNGVPQARAIVEKEKTQLQQMLDRLFMAKSETNLWTEVKIEQRKPTTSELTVNYNKNNEGMLTDGVITRYFGSGYEIRIKDGKTIALYFEGNRIPDDRVYKYETVIKKVIDRVDESLRKTKS